MRVQVRCYENIADSCTMIYVIGSPPKDEMKLLRKELLLLHSELLFERHKCDLHATRNRRLVGKVFQANAVREELSAVVKIFRLWLKIMC